MASSIPPSTRLVLRLIGAAGLIASAGIHLDLYLTGYRHIPTISWLFLLQCALGIAIALGILTADRLGTHLIAIGFSLETISGYAVSRFAGLFGFREQPTTAGLVAGLLEFAVIGALGVLAATSGPSLPLRSRTAAAIGLLRRPLVIALVSAGSLAVVLAAGIGSTTTAGSAAPPPAAGSVVRVVIVNFAFQPSQVVARPGEVISVTNKDPVVHTLTAVPDSRPFVHFDTGDIAPGKTKRFDAPRAVGTYAFYCSIHNFMTGELTVRS